MFTRFSLPVFKCSSVCRLAIALALSTCVFSIARGEEIAKTFYVDFGNVIVIGKFAGTVVPSGGGKTLDELHSVAISTHAGLPWLRRIRQEVGDKVHFWPFDGWDVPKKKSVIAEVDPSILRNRYPKEGRTADQQDAYSVAQWLTKTDKRDFLAPCFRPLLTEDEWRVVDLEGWILGIM